MSAARWALAGAFVALAVLSVPGPASATVSGPCTVATVGGYNIRTGDGPVEVDAGQALAYHFEAPVVVSSYEGTLEYAFFSIPIGRGNGDGSQIADGSFDLTTFRSLGTGLYQVRAHVALADGSSCDGSFQVLVRGGIFSSILGITSVVVSLAGLGAIIGVTVQTSAGVNALYVDPRLKP